MVEFTNFNIFKFDKKWTDIVLIAINRSDTEITMKFINHGAHTDPHLQIKLI